MSKRLLCLILTLVWMFWGGLSPSFATPVSRDQALHVLNRLAFGPAPGDIERVQQLGIDAYIEQQLYPESIPMPEALGQRLIGLRRNEMTQADLIKNWQRVASAAVKDTSGGGPGSPVAVRNAYYRAMTIHFGELRLFEAIDSPRQLNEVMVNFWFNHFNVVNNKRVTRVLIGDYERTAIRPYAMGRFRDMLGAVAKHPAMLFYLDNWVSSAPGVSVVIPGTKRRVSGINENFARELMELHTLGVNGGYTQGDVTTLARMLTGWTYNPRAGDAQATFTFAPSMHDQGQKIWLGQKVPVTDQAEGEWALDVLAKHPATAHHISYKLAQYFVADEPPVELVNSMAKVFLSSDGDIRAVLKALFASEQFRSPSAFGAKFKTPYEYVISAVRAKGGEINNVRPLLATMYRMGMPLHRCGSPDGYKNTEMTWLNPGAIAQRVEFATALSLGRLRLGEFAKGPDTTAMDARSSAMMPAIPENDALDKINPGNRATDPPGNLVDMRLTLAESTPTPESVLLADRAKPGLGTALILGSPSFMRR